MVAGYYVASGPALDAGRLAWALLGTALVAVTLSEARRPAPHLGQRLRVRLVEARVHGAGRQPVERAEGVAVVLRDRLDTAVVGDRVHDVARERAVAGCH